MVEQPMGAKVKFSFGVPSWIYSAARLHPIRGSNIMRFWSDLSMWNKYGIAAVGAAIVVAIIALVI